jgi:hypothetical protein
MALEPIPGDPGGSLRKLDIVQEDEQVGHPRFVKESREGGEVGLIGGKDHEKCLKCQKCLKLKNNPRGRPLTATKDRQNSNTKRDKKKQDVWPWSQVF